MCYKVFIVTLAAVYVTGRPQHEFSQRQTQFTPVEGTVFGDNFMPNRNARNEGSNQFLNREDGPQRSNSRETISQRHTPSVNIPVEGTVFGDNFVPNRAVNSHNPATNQFFNQDAGEKNQNNEKGTTLKPDSYTKVNTEDYESDSLDRSDNNNQRSTATPNENKFDRKNKLRNGTFDDTNIFSNASKMSKSMHSNKRKIAPNARRREGNPTQDMQNSLIPNITDTNQVLYTYTPKLSPRPQQNGQKNLSTKQVPNVLRDNRTSSSRSDNSNQTHRANPDHRSNGDVSDQNRRPVSGSVNIANGSPSNSSLQPDDHVYTIERSDDLDEDQEEGDKWIWGYSNVTERGVTGTTPDLDDRANFEGGLCPTGQAKIGKKCVDKD